MIEVTGLSAAYGSVPVLHGIDLAVGAGEFCTVLGANGAGKTTLLKALIGVHRAKGVVRLDGQDVSRAPAWKRVRQGMALCPEGRKLFPGLTVRQNLELGLRGVGRAEDVEAIERVVELFPRLGERMGQVAGSLSGGEQQMCALGRALVTSPKLLMLDEPSLGLAPVIVESVFAVLREVNREGTAVLLVEQNAALALGVADRAYVLERGRVALAGKADELAQNSAVQRAYLGGTEDFDEGASSSGR